MNGIDYQYMMKKDLTKRIFKFFVILMVMMIFVSFVSYMSRAEEEEENGENDNDVEYVELETDVDGIGIVEPRVGTHSIEKGNETEIRALASEGWEFVRWRGDTHLIYSPRGLDDDTSVMFTAENDGKIIAVFEEVEEEDEGLDLVTISIISLVLLVISGALIMKEKNGKKRLSSKSRRR